jgi:hypothetical protein
MFIDKRNKHYFLKIVNGNYEYVDINIFIELASLFSNTPRILKSDSRKEAGKSKFTPKVLIKGTACLLTLTTILGVSKEVLSYAIHHEPISINDNYVTEPSNENDISKPSNENHIFKLS